MLDILRGLNIYPVLVSSKLSKHTGRKYICDRCLHYFSSSDKLQSHTADCREVNYCAIRLPSEDNKWLSFKNHSRKERLPFVVYADLECVLKKTQPETEHAPYAYQHHRMVWKHRAGRKRLERILQHLNQQSNFPVITSVLTRRFISEDALAELHRLNRLHSALE
ncbi:uncharacterized protein [Temnothorax nylanderi]|uniref:uncharacterized protein isoform X1 n=1 Tax=Temnothorax nylanderi TaxID=102681 RepID=UPI003A8C4898